jgi:hypothetical protein
MAGGGLIQLVSIGAQDVYLVGNPQITFFKVTYQRHTNFARECIEQTIQGTTGFNQRLTVIVSRSGDLVGPMHIEFALPSLPFNIVSSGTTVQTSNGSSTLSSDEGFQWAWVNYVGFRLLNEVTVEIGGQPIDRHYATWFYMWFELSTPASKREGLQEMVGGWDVTANPLSYFNNATVPKRLYVPLVFWFNTHPGLALPLIALQYHEVKLYIKVETLKNCVINFHLPSGAAADPVWAPDAALPSISSDSFDVSVWADYYYLDSEERRRFAQLSHEYLIKQVQQVSMSGESITPTSSKTIKMDYKTLNHPVVFNTWALQPTYHSDNNDWTNFTNSPPFLPYLGKNIMDSHKLVLNGNDRYNAKHAGYYNLVQPYNHFTTVPPTGILAYSYALQPVEHQPSGSLNFSRIDNAFNVMTTDNTLDRLNDVGSGASNAWSSNMTAVNAIGYAVNYNVLRIMSGMGGLAYSN